MLSETVPCIGVFHEAPFETVLLNMAPFYAGFPMMSNAKARCWEFMLYPRTTYLTFKRQA